MAKTERTTTKLPRGEYRARWDMPQDPDNWYDRNKVKKQVKEFVCESEDDTNWCPFCGVGSEVMGDEPCEKCHNKMLQGNRK